MFSVTLDSKDAEAAIRQMEAALRAVGAYRQEFYSDRPYAFGIETGYRRDGRLARRAGGARMFEQGIERSGEKLEQFVAEGVPYGPQGVNSATKRWGRLVAVPAIQSLTPVRSGALRKSVMVREAV